MNKIDCIIMDWAGSAVDYGCFAPVAAFLKAFDEIEDGAQGIIRITLKYDEKGNRVIDGLRRISKPGLRIYASKDELPKVLNGLGIALISTSKGIMTDKKARELGIGGEVLAYIW